MAEKQETIADIIAEMKRRKEMLEDAAFNAPLCYSTETMRAQYEILDEFVERLEAAHKREVDALEQRCAELNAEVAAKDEVIKRLNDAISEEQRRKMATTEKSSAVGNAAKLREALEYVLDFDATDDTAMEDGLTDGERVAEYADHIEECQKRARAALAAPPRNCDVGTAEEQAERYGRHCDKFIRDRMHCEECPCCGKIPFGNCEFAWAQTPYEEGGAK